jgi:hypothetical protein
MDLLNKLKEGVIELQNRLLLPRFYLAKGIEDWLPERLEKWQTARDYVIM